MISSRGDHPAIPHQSAFSVMKHSLAGLLALLFAFSAYAQDSHTITSPNGRVEVRVTTEDQLSYDVSFDGKPVMVGSTLSMTIQGRTPGRGDRVTGGETRQGDQVIDVPVPLKHARLREAYNEPKIGRADA